MGQFLSRVTKGKQLRPRRTLLYGTHGIGKSTWAAEWPSAVVVPTEDGCADIDVASFPVCETVEEAWGAIIELGGDEDHGFKTVVVDSADWLEQLVWKTVCEKHGKKAITDFDFGKGYGEAASIFGKILHALDGCRDKGLHVVILAHCDVVKFSDPQNESYDRYMPKLHKSVSGMLQEWADEVLFANYKRYVRKEDLGFKKTRGIASGDERVLYTQESAGFLAKNRLGLPQELPLDFAAYEPFLTGDN